MLLKKKCLCSSRSFFFNCSCPQFFVCYYLKTCVLGEPSGNNSLYIYDLQILEKNEEHVVPKSTWAEIVKGEPRNFNVNSIGYEASFPPLTSSVNAEKHDKK